ncbi:MAG: hypothetical protein HRT53_20870 [Colwellia sp.]|nr:hypothetical protein [Colwellia sp.]
MNLVIKPNKAQALNLKQQMQLLALPANKRVRILKTLGRYERAKTRKRIREQRTLDGKKFSPRADGKKTRMLKKMGRTLEPYVKNSNRLELKHKNVHTGRIAALQQNGGTERMSAARMARIHGKPDYKAPCTRSQAKALRNEGYKVKRGKGKGYRKASIREIMADLSQGKASLILGQLRNKTKNSSWQISVKARPHLGDTSIAVQQQLIKILAQVNQRTRG